MTDKEQDPLDQIDPLGRMLDVVAQACAGEYSGFEISEAHVRQIFERALEEFGPTFGAATHIGATYGLYPFDPRTLCLAIEMGRETGDLKKRLERLEKVAGVKPEEEEP